VASVVSAVVYILAGVDGNTWTAQVLNKLLIAVYCINLFSYGVILRIGQNKYVFHNLVFLLLLFVFSVIGIIGSFPGTGDRFGNNGVDTLIWIGLFNYLYLAIVLREQFLSAIVAVLITFPVVAVAAYFYLTVPMKDEIGEIDLEKTCVLRIANMNSDEANVDRIQSFSDIGLGLIIGEHTDRVVKIEDSEAQIWRYGAREFSHLRRNTSLKKHCEM
jgi:hypothetical protein